MFSHIGVKLAQFLLERGNLSFEDSSVLIGTVLDKTGALPYKDIIEYGADGSLIIGGEPLNMEQAKYLRDSAIAAINNQAINLIMERVSYLAVLQGIHKAETIPQLYYGKVGIWWGQNIKKILQDLAQEGNSGLNGN